jgi:hypothetical protein
LFANALCATLLLAAAAGAQSAPARPEVELTTLLGGQHTGQLAALAGERATLKAGDKTIDVPLAEVLEVRNLRAKAATVPDARRPELSLTDGSRISWQSVVVDERQFHVDSPQLGKFALPVTAVSSVRFAPLDPAVAEAWKELAGRSLTQDMLVIRKANVLDHLDGIVGAIDDVGIHFVLDGKEHQLKRDKVFGVVYARRNADVGKPVCEFTSVAGDFLKAQHLEWSDGRFKLGLLGGARVEAGPEQFLSLDYSLGKVRYLSQLEPREVKYTPFFDHVWTYYRDRPRDGGALRLGNKEYARGLWIHSRTRLKYRLNGEYRRFQAVMGIDQAVAPLGNVHVVLSGDGKTLHESDVRGADEPRRLDLDVTGVRELEIFVDFGTDLDIADHLDLADAKVIK